MRPVPNFADAPLSRLYLHELYLHTHNIRRKTLELFDQTPIPPDGDQLIVDAALHSLIASTLSDAAAAKSLLADHSRRGENARRTAFRLQRTRHIAEILAGIEYRTIMDKAVRNSLEHFDEYLDEANISLADSGLLGTRASYNIVVTRRALLQRVGSAYPIRLYVADERIFENFTTKIDMNALHLEASAIAERVGAELGVEEGGPGGLLLDV